MAVLSLSKTIILNTEETNIGNGLGQADFEQLFKLNFKDLCFFAFQYVKDIEIARELVQESFVALWEKRFTIDPERPVKAYLRTSIYNRCMNYIRDHRKFTRDLLVLENLIPEPGMQPGQQMIAGELQKQIEAAIDSLPEKCREVFVMSRFQGFKYQEIADKLDISVKTVETQMSKALLHMRHRLSDHLPVWLTFILLTNFFHS